MSSYYEPLLKIFDKTIQYSNIFDYPLTQEELHLFALSAQSFSQESLEQWILKNRDLLKEKFTEKDGYWSVKGRPKLKKIRADREKISRAKLRSAKIWCWPLVFVPWIRCVCVSGAVAANNAQKDDDIDLFVITSPRRIWISRAVILIYFSFFGRRYNLNREKGNAVTFCLNHMIDTHHLVSPHQDLYTANDIARLRVILNKGNIFTDFLSHNQWVKFFLANWFQESQEKRADRHLPQKLKIKNYPFLQHTVFVTLAPFKTPLIILSWFIDWLNHSLGNLQMKKLRQNYPEINLSDGHPLQYHPRNNREWILREFQLTQHGQRL